MQFQIMSLVERLRSGGIGEWAITRTLRQRSFSPIIPKSLKMLQRAHAPFRFKSGAVGLASEPEIPLQRGSRDLQSLNSVTPALSIFEVEKSSFR
jgi:hypothetical protein